MLTFFRKIRRWLLAENKFSRYLLYAAGEILLVMIGILLALQVNNWNESRKMAISESMYLNVLKTEFEENQKKLQSAIKTNETNLKYARDLSELIGKSSPVLSLELLRELLFGVINTEVQYRPNNGVINEIINSGKLELFQDESLRFMISGWDGELLKVKFQEQEEVHIVRLDLFDIISEKTSFKDMLHSYNGNMFLLTQSELKSDEYALLESLQLENTLARFIAASSYLGIRYKQLYEVQGELLEKIDKIQH